MLLVRRQTNAAVAVQPLASGVDPVLRVRTRDAAPLSPAPPPPVSPSFASNATSPTSTTSNAPDVALLTALAEGGAAADAALRTLFERHAGWLAQRLRRGLPAHAVEDVLQETFLAVWRAGSRTNPGAGYAFAGQGEVSAWLWGIARRQAALWLRRYLRGPQVQGQAQGLAGVIGSGVDAGDETRHDLRSSHDTATAAVQAVDLEIALRLLGPPGSDDRELVRLVLLEDRPLGEAAQALQVPTGTVKSRLFRIRQRLRAALHDETDTPASTATSSERRRSPDA